MVQAIAGDQISKLKKFEPLRTKVAIGRLVTDLMMAFNADMSEQQISMLVNQILQEFWYFKIEELAFIFQQAITGKRKIYGKLNVAEIMNWLHDYDVNERQNYISSINGTNDKTDYFREVEQKEKIQMGNERKKQVMRLSAIEEAKRIVDNKKPKP